jgi:probable rRNA maturation factor
VTAPLPPVPAEAFVLQILARLDKHGWDISVVFCDDAEIRALNKTWRGLDEATDILSFPLGDDFTEDGVTRYNAGDLVISVETLRENAAYFQVDELRELRRLLIHGILHLAGYDHPSNERTEPMLVLQEELLDVLEAS